MQFFNYAPERKEEGKSKIYSRFFLIGIIAAILAIFFGNLLIIIGKFVIKNWKVVGGIIIVLLLFIKFIRRKKGEKIVIKKK